MRSIKEAREYYRPENVKVLFIAEAPPSSLDRFFYYPKVKSGDSLFLYIIRAVFPSLDEMATAELRMLKPKFLNQFKTIGYFLEDSVEQPISQGTSSTKKVAILNSGQSALLERIEPYKSDSKIVLISSTVYTANYNYLKGHGFNIIHTSAIPFPGSGQQKRFVEAIEKIDLT